MLSLRRRVKKIGVPQLTRGGARTLVFRIGSTFVISREKIHT